MSEETHQRAPSFIEVVKGVGSAVLGVRSEAYRRRDFAHGRTHHYIVIGAAVAASVVAAIFGLENLVLFIVHVTGSA